ncbi:MAG TPA: Rieske 2Fe-2S domain-containing protein [Roseivirga sp.]
MKAIKVFDSRQSLEKIFIDRNIRRLRIGDIKLCIAQHKRAYFAFELLCPHQRQPLDEGQITEFGEVVCPLHSYRFNLKSGQEAHHLCDDLKTFQLDISDEGVFINLY